MPRSALASVRILARACLLSLASLALTLLVGATFARAQQGEAGAPLASDVPSAMAQFTTGIEEREPIDQVTFVSNDVRKIYFYSDLRGLSGQTVTHRWSYQGQVRAEVAFQVRGPRWRVWSSKALLPGWVGDWTVEVVTDGGEVIAAETFSYSAPEA